MQVEEYEQLYQDFILPYFDPMEVKPLSRILQMYEDGNYQVYVIEEEGQTLAAAFFVRAPQARMYLLDYLAVAGKARGRGLGSRMLQCLMEQVASTSPIMIETEALAVAADEKNRQERVRRNHFYEKNGAFSCGFYTWVYGATYEIWLLGDETWKQNPEETENIVAAEQERIYRYMIPEPYYGKYVVIPYEIEK